jgi:hypothetical protein
MKRAHNYILSGTFCRRMDVNILLYGEGSYPVYDLK